MRIQDGYQSRTTLGTYRGKRAVLKSIKHPNVPILAFVERWVLRREGRILRSLENLGQVPQFLGFPDLNTLAIEYREGKTLRDVEDEGSIPRKFFRELEETVDRMHENGVVHADLKKKENIMINSSNSPVLLDFGTALQKGSSRRFINNFFYEQFRTLDRHAVQKLKIRYCPEEVTERDRKEYLKLSLLERVSRLFRWILPNRENPPPLTAKFED